MNSSSELWTRLSRVQSLSFTSKSRTGIGWSGTGSGTVEVDEFARDVLLFRESGSWQQGGGKELRFSNIFRWTWLEERIRLEHLRFGAERPVFLFEMAADEQGIWREINPHPCRDDCYRATLRVENAAIWVRWRVEGPKRDEIIEYVYEGRD